MVDRGDAVIRVASSVEHTVLLLSWNYPKWKKFLRDLFTDGVTGDGRIYVRKYLDMARDRYGASPRTVQRWFKTLKDIGVLDKHKEGKVGESGSWYYTISDLFKATIKNMARLL